ncbi:MAG: nucleotidyl transferase AbiEii/AbiGii toxin family protein [Thermoplasmata archaeon]
MDELKRLSGRKKIPQGIIYKDYVITVILEDISRKDYKEDLIFKGGTCLKKIYFDETRFSVDIDFTCTRQKVSDELLTDLKGDIEDKTVRGVSFGGIKEDRGWADSVSFKLGYYDLNEHPNSVKIDLSFREQPILKPEIKHVLIPDYGRIDKFEMYVFPLKEILSEKIRALITRGAARDVFDVWFLLKNGVELDISLVEEKMDLYDEEFDMEEFIDKIGEMESKWKRDLGMLVPEAPGFETVKEEIRSIL